MDIEHDNRDAPSYLAHYGMHRPPFATRCEDDMYYEEPTRTQRLDILLHLTQYGNEMLLVTGPEGSGKSTLMRHFLQNAPPNWKICSLEARANLDPEQLLYRICHTYNLPVEPDALNEMILSVKRQLDQLLAGTSTVVIVVDNAHTLPPGVLALLTDFAKIKNHHSEAILRIVLFAEPQIKIQLASIELDHKLKYPIRKIDLPPFDEKHTGELIRHRTRTAGLVADSTFTPAAVSKIHKQSAGIPGNIMELAHRVLFEMTPLKRRTKANAGNTPNGKTRSPLKLALGIIVVAVIALILVFRNEINRLYNQQASGPDNRRTTEPLILPQMDEQALEREANALEESQAAVEQPIHDDTGDKAIIVADLEPDEPDRSLINSNHNEETATSATASQELARNIHQEPWLLEQKPAYYTLQLVAGYQVSTVNNYLKRHKLPATELAYYHSLNKGKHWHSLVYGIYPDYSSAKHAINTLPPEARKATPWIRRLKNIQSEIKEARKSSGNF